MARFAIISLDNQDKAGICWVCASHDGLAITTTVEERKYRNKITHTLNSALLEDAWVILSNGNRLQRVRELINKEIGNEN